MYFPSSAENTLHIELLSSRSSNLTITKTFPPSRFDDHFCFVCNNISVTLKKRTIVLGALSRDVSDRVEKRTRLEP